jgi:Flp pilus assembly pilin Flp
MFARNTHGQTFIEYTLMVGALVAVMIAMTPMMRRGIQAMVKVTADQIGTQQGSEQIGGRFGRMMNSTTYSQAQGDTEVGERLGATSKKFLTDKTSSQSTVYLNQGFTEKND